MLPFLPLSNLFLRLQICDSKKSLPFFSFSEASVQTLSPRIQHSPSFSFWSHIYKLLYALDPYTQWLTFWFSVMPCIFSFCTLYLFFLLPDMTCPFLSWKDSCISIKKHFQQYLLWKLPDLCQGKHCAPEYFESKYPKRCVVIFYLYVCLLYLM